ERGKSDPIDALAIARLALREGQQLPVACLDERTRPLRLLTDHRDALVAERTRMINRLRWHLHDLAPDLAPRARALSQHTARRPPARPTAAAPASRRPPRRRRPAHPHPGTVRRDRRP